MSQRTSTNVSFHGESVRFTKHNNSIYVRVADLASILDICNTTEMVRRSNSPVTTIQYLFSNAYGLRIDEAITVVKNAPAPPILRDMLYRWLKDNTGRLRSILAISDAPGLRLEGVPGDKLMTVRWFMACNDLDFNDYTAQRLGVLASRIRDARGHQKQTAEIRIQMETRSLSHSFIKRSENLYPYSILVEAYNKLFT